MSDTTATLTPTQEDALIRAWAHDYAASYAAAAAQLKAEIRTIALAYPDARDAQATHLAIESSGWTPPTVPAALRPAWAIDVDVHDAGAREVSITFTGTTHGDTACLERFYAVTVLDPHNTGTLGTWETEGTKVWAECLSEDLTAAAARELAAALTAAAAELEATAPHPSLPRRTDVDERARTALENE